MSRQDPTEFTREKILSDPQAQADIAALVNIDMHKWRVGRHTQMDIMSEHKLFRAKDRRERTVQMELDAPQKLEEFREDRENEYVANKMKKRANFERAVRADRKRDVDMKTDFVRAQEQRKQKYDEAVARKKLMEKNIADTHAKDHRNEIDRLNDQLRAINYKQDRWMQTNIYDVAYKLVKHERVEELRQRGEIDDGGDPFRGEDGDRWDERYQAIINELAETEPISHMLDSMDAEQEPLKARLDELTQTYEDAVELTGDDDDDEEFEDAIDDDEEIVGGRSDRWSSPFVWTDESLMTTICLGATVIVSTAASAFV